MSQINTYTSKRRLEKQIVVINCYWYLINYRNREINSYPLLYETKSFIDENGDWIDEVIEGANPKHMVFRIQFRK